MEEAVKVAQAIGAKVNVPNHYGMFASNTEDPRKFLLKKVRLDAIMETQKSTFFVAERW